MRRIPDASRLFAQEAGAKDGSGAALKQRGDEARNIGGGVLAIGILNQNEIAPGPGKAGFESLCFSTVHRVADEGDLRMFGRKLGGDFRGAIPGAIVYDDDLEQAVQESSFWTTEASVSCSL